MGRLKWIYLSVVIIFTTFYFSSANQVKHEEALKFNDMEYLSKSLINHPKICLQLKNEFRKHQNNNPTSLEKQQKDIIIEFSGGITRALREYEAESASGVIKKSLTRGQKIYKLVEKLQILAEASQKAVLQLLKVQNKDYKSFWITNEISVKGADAHLVIEIVEKFENVKLVRSVDTIPIPKPQPPEIPSDDNRERADVYPWNINLIKARCDTITSTCLGEGIVVAILDTGVLWKHIELKDNYRNDQYSWLDPVNKTTVPTPCAEESCDHGTHVCGVAVGKTVGIAPKAKWIACKMLGGGANATTTMECAQWATCPEQYLNPKATDCSAAPNVINNSWGTPAIRQTTPDNSKYKIVQVWNMAGIVSIFAAGNDGPWCTTIGPPGRYDIAIAIGNVDNTRTIAVSSSRGPVLNVPEMGDTGTGTPDSAAFGSCQKYCGNLVGAVTEPVTGQPDGINICTLTKPDLSAPGTNIRSSVSASENSYAEHTGTSVAAPAVSGVVILILCANNRTPGSQPLDVNTVRYILTSTCDQKSGSDLAQGNPNNPNDPLNFARTSYLLCDPAFGRCGCPDNLYGAGITNACKAVEYVTRPKHNH